MNKLNPVTKAAIYATVAYTYATTDSEPVRGVMERTLERLLQERRVRRERQELRDITSAYLHARREYANHTIHTAAVVVRITETAIPRFYRQLKERGIDPCTLD